MTAFFEYNNLINKDSLIFTIYIFFDGEEIFFDGEEIFFDGKEIHYEFTIKKFRDINLIPVQSQQFFIKKDCCRTDTI